MLDGLVAERCGEHRFADAGRADQQHVGALFDEPQGGEVFDESAIERWLRCEVELLERLARWQPGEPQPALEAALLGRGDFGGEQVGEEPRVAGLVAFGGL